MDLASYAMNDLLSSLNREEADRRARERKTEAFRSDPNKLDKLVASITANISPTGKKPKLSDFSSQVEAYDSTIPEGHPFKGFGSELKQRMSRVMQDSRSRGLSPIDIADHLSKKMLMEPGKSGAPRLQEAFEHKRRVDAAWFGIGGEDETVRKPFGGLYDEWLSAQKESEKPENIAAALRKAGKVKEAEEYEEDISPLPTATGLGINVGAGALAGGLVAGPAGALVGAAGGALSEVFGRPIAKAVEQTDWYKSKWGKLTSTREESSIAAMLTGGAVGGAAGLSKLGVIGGAVGALGGAAAMTDTGKQLLTDIAPYLVGGVAIDKALASAFLVTKSAGKAIAASPTAKNIIEGEAAIQQGKKLMSDENVIGRTVNKLFDTSKYELGVNEEFVQGFVDLSRKLSGKDKLSKNVMRKVIEEGERHAQQIAGTAERMKYAANVGEEEFVGLASRSMKEVVQDPIAMEEAMRHPSGFLAGAIEAAPKVRPRQLAESIAANDRVENELLSAVQAFNKDKTVITAARKVEQDFSNISDVHDLLYGGKQYVPEIEDVHSVLYGGNAPTSTVAKIVDDVSAVRREAPSRSYSTIAKIMNSYETDLVAKKVLDTVTAPTTADELFAPSSGVTVAPTAKKLSAKMRIAKIDLLRRRGDPESLEAAAYEEAKMLREDRLAEQARLKSIADEEAKAKELDKAYGSSIDDEVQGRTSAKSTVKEDEYSAWKSNEVATEEELGKTEIARGKSKKISAEQEARLVEQKRAEMEMAAEAARIRKLDPETADGLIQRLAADHAAGKVTAEEALKKTELIIDTITDPTAEKFATDAGLYEWAGRFDGFTSFLKNKVGTKAFMAAFGVPAGLMTFFTGSQGGVGEQAEAGMLGSIGKAIGTGLKAATDIGPEAMNLMRGMQKAGYITSQNIPADKFLLRFDEFQRGLRGSLAGGPAKIISAFDEWVSKGGKESLRHKLMSPGMIFEEILGVGKSLMNNPAVFKGSFQAAEYNNIMRASRVVENILSDSGIKSASKEVREMFKPLTSYMQKQVEFDYRSGQIEELTRELSRYAEGKPKGMKSDMFEASKESAERKLAEHQKAIEGLKNIIPEYHQKWAVIAEEAAKKHSSVRTFLALGDSPTFEKYPFLKNIQFSSEEKVAIGRFREQLLQYKERLKDIKEDVIDKWYAPHIFHPDFKPKEFLNLVGGDSHKANAYMSMYRRSFNSRPLMPDIEASMLRYTSDIERRIQQQTFWKREGWQQVMEKTKDIPVIYNAFKALKEGVAPMEMTPGNKLAQRYAEFEVVKRLFLSPSATLKHLIKVTGDLASRPFAEAVEATAPNLKMLGIRLAEANPTMRKSLEKLGFTAKNEQDRILQDYFKSLVPAHGTRRMMLDIGLSPMDEVFTKAKGVWGKIQDVGGAGINFAELADRGLTLTLGRQIAAKKGMTIEQALYGTYDMLLKNNFLSRELNPAWLNNPKIKAMMMFQGTPFKIFERRMVNFLRSSRVVKDLGEGIYNATKADLKAGNFNNTRMILRDLRNLRADVKEGEHALTSNLFLNAALQETDFFGVPTINTFAKDVLITGAATYLGGQAGMNLYHHFFHLPFLQSTTDEPTLNLNPGLTAIMRGYKAWKLREEGDDEFLTTKIMQRWLGSGWTGLLPDTARKALRMSNNDIPKIYQDSKYKYLFAIPSIKDK